MSLAMLVISCGGETSSSNVGDDTYDTEVDDTVVTVKPPKRSLLAAVDQDKVDIIQQHMDAGTDPNEFSAPIGVVMIHLSQYGAEGAFPLHLAVLKDNKESAKILLDNGADIDIKTKNENGFTPLHWAAYYCSKDMVTMLIESGAPVNSLDAHNATSLDALLLGEETGKAMRGEQTSEKTEFASGADQLTPGCVGKLGLEDAEKTKLLEGITTIFSKNGGKLGKDL